MTPTIYRPSRPIAGVRPIFVLPLKEDEEYYDRMGGAPEAPLIQWVAEMLDPAARVIDCGTHIGTWSMVLAMRGHHVVGFEPNEELFSLYLAGASLNVLKIEAYRYGLSDEVKDARLTYISPDGGGGSVVVDYGSNATVKGVRLRPLDSFSVAVDFLKIDAEGHELPILRGARETIRAWRPRIGFECWDDERGQKREDVFRYLRDDLGYAVTKTSWPEFYMADPI